VTTVIEKPIPPDTQVKKRVGTSVKTVETPAPSPGVPQTVERTSPGLEVTVTEGSGKETETTATNLPATRRSEGVTLALLGIGSASFFTGLFWGRVKQITFPGGALILAEEAAVLSDKAEKALAELREVDTELKQAADTSERRAIVAEWRLEEGIHRLDERLRRIERRS
jgi:hypothetical protein